MRDCMGLGGESCACEGCRGEGRAARSARYGRVLAWLCPNCCSDVRQNGREHEAWTAETTEGACPECAAWLTLNTDHTLRDEAWYALTVDGDNSGDEFWAALREAYPRLAAELSDSEGVIVSQRALDCLERLPGWDSGSECAPTPLIVHPAHSDEWCDVCAGVHASFEVAD